MKTLEQFLKEEKNESKGPDFVMIILVTILFVGVCFAFARAVDGPERNETQVKQAIVKPMKGTSP